MALAAFCTGGFSPRRFRLIAWQGMLIAVVGLVGGACLVLVVAKLLLDPP